MIVRVHGWTLRINSLEPDKNSLLYQKPKTPKELEQEKKERNVKLTRIAKGIGVLIRGVGTFFYKLGDGIVKSCDKSLGKPENKAILKRMGKLPKAEKEEVKKAEKDAIPTPESPVKEIVIKIPRD